MEMKNRIREVFRWKNERCNESFAARRDPSVHACNSPNFFHLLSFLMMIKSSTKSNIYGRVEVRRAANLRELPSERRSEPGSSKAAARAG